MDEATREVVGSQKRTPERQDLDQPLVPVLVAIGLFLVIFVLRVAVNEADAWITAFYVVPVAVLAAVYGLRVGAAASAVGCALVVAWVAIDGISLPPLSWVGRIVPLVLVGVLVGETADRLRATSITTAASFARRLGAVEAAEIRESVLPQLTDAKRNLDAGRVAEGREALEGGLAAVERLLDDLERGDG